MNFSDSTTDIVEIRNTTAQVYQKPFGDEAVILAGIIIFTFVTIGLTLNSLTIAVIRRTPQLQNIFMSFIVSLCVSDLLSATISPLFWYRRTLGFDVWNLPNFFCKLYWSVDILTSFSTSMHILNFAILRYISIKHAPTFGRISMRMGNIWIATIWFIAFTCGFIPFWIFFGAEPGVERDRFSDATNAKWPACTLELTWEKHYTLYTYIGYTMFLLVPMAGVIIISILIAKAVHSHSVSSVVTNDHAMKRRLRKEKQAVLQLVLIVASFMFGYIPYVTYEIWSLTSSNPVADYWFGLTEYFCLRFSECMNPIFYNVSSSKMRRHTKRFLKKLCRCFDAIKPSTIVSNSFGPSSTSTSADGNNRMGV
uniref:growth hormone secretagogue receptor type 1-like n=1 Tax=Styela clava TaxID=7725 RepID=UPI001939F605|nr:growth hormone secretagogue receptor type 1-like [Styela clava]